MLTPVYRQSYRMLMMTMMRTTMMIVAVSLIVILRSILHNEIMVYR